MNGNDGLVLYLDFDGVLHHENVLWHPKVGPYLSATSDRYKLFMHVDLLDDLLAPYPQVLIVLSTFWAKRYDVVKVAKNLSPTLRARVIGGTWHSRMSSHEFMDKPRGVQVHEDALRRRPRDRVSIDDNFVGWPASCINKFVRTHPHDCTQVGG